MKELWRKVTAFSRRREMADDVLEEMRTHVEMASDSDDPYAAQRKFGNTTLLLEDSIAVWGWPRLEGWLRDLRYATRPLPQARVQRHAAGIVVDVWSGSGWTASVSSPPTQRYFAKLKNLLILFPRGWGVSR